MNKKSIKIFNEYIVSNINETNVKIQKCRNNLRENGQKISEADKPAQLWSAQAAKLWL